MHGLAPPHTRGSTRAVPAVIGVRAGSPAHAGIDPPAPSPRTRPPGLPRTRGDRPQKAATDEARAGAPPHTRGSTLARAGASRARLGSPAHAGIDPTSRKGTSIRSRLPRTRGDRPRCSRSLLLIVPAPPHTRGSTPRSLSDGREDDGSPAHAGIDPPMPAARPCARWLPRTRGDRPLHALRLLIRSPASPHTRGSTVELAADDRRHLGSPAHAGIDPLLPATLAWRKRLPRTRGDRPRPVSAPLLRSSAPPHTRGSTPCRPLPQAFVGGSPAHAGIDPRTVIRRLPRVRLPRTRGDRPPKDFPSTRFRVAPPHTRGSTLVISRTAVAEQGSPAHAGIDPSGFAGGEPPVRLPRTRGDRPPCF